jgi:hypothetical protein
VLQDIPAVAGDPRDDIPDGAVLVPPPFLAAPAALPAVLIWCQGRSPVDYMSEGFLVIVPRGGWPKTCSCPPAQERLTSL